MIVFVVLVTGLLNGVVLHKPIISEASRDLIFDVIHGKLALLCDLLLCMLFKTGGTKSGSIVI